MRTLNFVKEYGQWFFDKPWIEKIVGKSSMAMVAGADTMLDILSEGSDSVSLEVTTSKKSYWFSIERERGATINGGADYKGWYHSMWVQNQILETK